jgi:ATP-dependent DNA helicase RecG
MNERMTNQSLKDRFKLPENKTATVSQVIAESVDAHLIRLDNTATASRRYARYLPFWA